MIDDTYTAAELHEIIDDLTLTRKVLQGWMDYCPVNILREPRLSSDDLMAVALIRARPERFDYIAVVETPCVSLGTLEDDLCAGTANAKRKLQKADRNVAKRIDYLRRQLDRRPSGRVA